MKLFISGEIDGSKVEDKIGDKLRDVLHDVEPKINSVIGKKSMRFFLRRLPTED